MTNPTQHVETTVLHMSIYFTMAMLGLLAMEVYNQHEIGFAFGALGTLWYIITPIYYGHKNGYTPA